MFDDRDDLVWLERLLDGADGADAIQREDAPASCAGLADVLLAAWAPASPDDFAGEAAVRAMFRSLAAGERAERTPFARRAKAIAVAASLGATAMTGVAAAAGRLPPDVQDMASQLLDRIGIHVPAAERRHVPLEVPAGVSNGVGAGAAVAPTVGPPGPRPSTESGVVQPSAGPVDGLTEPANPTAVRRRAAGGDHRRRRRLSPADRRARAGARRDDTADRPRSGCGAEHPGAGGRGDPRLRRRVIRRRPRRMRRPHRRRPARNRRRRPTTGSRRRRAWIPPVRIRWASGAGTPVRLLVRPPVSPPIRRRRRRPVRLPTSRALGTRPPPAGPPAEVPAARGAPPSATPRPARRGRSAGSRCGSARSPGPTLSLVRVSPPGGADLRHSDGVSRPWRGRRSGRRCRRGGSSGRSGPSTSLQHEAAVDRLLGDERRHHRRAHVLGRTGDDDDRGRQARRASPTSSALPAFYDGVGLRVPATPLARTQHHRPGGDHGAHRRRSPSRSRRHHQPLRHVVDGAPRRRVEHPPATASAVAQQKRHIQVRAADQSGR